MKNLLVSLDVGTTAIKAGVFSIEGDPFGTSYIECSLIYPARWHVEQDANLWWSLARQAIHQVLRSPHLDPSDVAAISVSAQGISFVPVDAKGQPLGNALSWLDTRATPQAERLDQLFPSRDHAFRRLGTHVVPTYMLPKLMWLKENRSETFDAASKFSTCLDFVNKRLVDRFVTDYSVAGGTLMHDLRALDWTRDILDLLHIPVNKLPDIEWAGTPLGLIRPDTADELGLPYDVKVVLGGHDQECAALGAGLGKNEVSISLGTASILVAAVEQPIYDPGLRIPCYPHVERDLFVLEAVVSTAGVALRWLRDLFNAVSSAGQRMPFDYQVMDALAEESPAGANGTFFYPHLSGATSPFWDPKATGVFHGVSLATSVSDIVRAVLEGWCFQIKSNLLVIEELTHRRKRVIVFGGGARSPFMRQLLANVLDRPLIVLPTSETALSGAAMLAGFGAGLYTDLESAKAVGRKGTVLVEPEPTDTLDYAELYAQYRQLEERIVFSREWEMYSTTSLARNGGDA